MWVALIVVNVLLIRKNGKLVGSWSGQQIVWSDYSQLDKFSSPNIALAFKVCSKRLLSARQKLADFQPYLKQDVSSPEAKVMLDSITPPMTIVYFFASGAVGHL